VRRSWSDLRLPFESEDFAALIFPLCSSILYNFPKIRYGNPKKPAIFKGPCQHIYKVASAQDLLMGDLAGRKIPSPAWPEELERNPEGDGEHGFTIERLVACFPEGAGS
jgi:hypothetical protein